MSRTNNEIPNVGLMEESERWKSVWGDGGEHPNVGAKKVTQKERRKWTRNGPKWKQNESHNGPRNDAVLVISLACVFQFFMTFESSHFRTSKCQSLVSATLDLKI